MTEKRNKRVDQPSETGVDENEHAAIDLDISKAPLGNRAARQLVEAVAKLDDRVERHYLELKSSLGEGKTGISKIAKFILGAANRMPETAATAFKGYAVMIIGVSKDSIHGIPPIEIKDIEEIVVRHIGPNGPKWDHIHVPVAYSENSVLVITVEPPEDGQELFPCRKDGDSLHNGRVYIRVEGQTREARADEIDMLLERGRRSAEIEPSFAVQIVGSVHRIDYDAERTVEEYVRRKRVKLLQALPAPEPEPVPELEPDPDQTRAGFAASSNQSSRSRLASEATGLASSYAKISGLSAVTESMNKHLYEVMKSATKPTIPSFTRTIAEERTEDEYRASIETWEGKLREAWPGAIDTLAAWVFPSAAVQVTNNTKLFLRNVRLKIHLEGDVRGLHSIEHEGELPDHYLELPKTPRSWGPVEIDPLASVRHPTFVASDYVPSAYQSPLSWQNSGSVELTLDIGDLRPNDTHLFEEDEMVLVVPAGESDAVQGSWQITADGYHEIYSGRLQVPVFEPDDLTGALRSYFRLE